MKILLALILFFGGFITVAIAVKLREARKAARWPGVPGQVIAAKAAARTVTTHHASSDTDTNVSELRNFAQITYRYTVAGRPYTATRLSIREDLGNDDVAGKLARYPKGKQVTVFYDPANPANAVLERDLPAATMPVLIGLGAVLAAAAIALLTLTRAPNLIAPYLPNPRQAAPVTFLAAFAAAAALFAFGVFRQRRLARAWPVVSAEPEPADQPDGSRAYRYAVAGVTYSFNKDMFGSRPRPPRRDSSRTVLVRYDPANPARTCLARPGLEGVVPTLVAAAAAFLAFTIAHA